MLSNSNSFNENADHDQVSDLTAEWKPGDRVLVRLPDANGEPRGRWRSFAGMVREVNPPGLRPGVRVDLDVPVNGVRDCYATHAELRRE